MKAVVNTILILCVFFATSCSTAKGTGSLERDGSSFEKAVIVKNIGEEYEYVRRVCSGCEMQTQSLVFEKDKPYDILELKKPDGESVSYYFDISKFYGKGF